MEIAKDFSTKLLNKPLQIYENQSQIIDKSCSILNSLWNLSNIINLQQLLIDQSSALPLATTNQDEEQIWYQLKQQQDELLGNKQLNRLIKLKSKHNQQQNEQEVLQQEDDSEQGSDDNDQIEEEEQEFDEQEESQQQSQDQSEQEQFEKQNLQKFLEMAENEDMNQLDLEAGDDDDKNDSGKNAKYSDLWGQEESQDPDSDNDEHDNNNNNNQQDDHALEDDIFDEMRENDLQSTSVAHHDNQINKLEQKLISKKTWQLKGEISASNRPQDSLIKETLDFKSGIRLQEEITKEDNDNLESVIKQRILDQLWDDNEHYDTNANNIQENFNQLPEINFERPKGLAQTYEEEYKQSVLQLPTAKPEDKTKLEIEQQFKQLCYKLDLLSNLNFTPKPMQDKPAEILTNVPTILREEKIPIFVSEKQVMNERELFKTSKDAKFFVYFLEIFYLGFQDKQELTPEEKLKLRQKMKKNFKSRERHSNLKKKISKLSASNKFAYTLIQKNKKQQKIMEEMKKEKSIKFTKPAEFFKNLQENQDGKKLQKKKK